MAQTPVTVYCKIDDCTTTFNVMPRQVKGVLDQHRKQAHPDWKPPTVKAKPDPYRMDFWR